MSHGTHHHHPPGRLRDLAEALRGAFESGGWHGPTVLEVIDGVDAALADRRLPGASHSIHALLEHIAYWKRVCASRASGGTVPEPHDKDWAKPRRTWEETVAHAKASHEALLHVVASLREKDLDAPVATSEGSRPLHVVLHGVVAHDVYHAGQIRLLAGILRAAGPDQP